VAFLLQGVLLGVGCAVDFKRAGLYLDALAFALAFDQDTGDAEGRAGGDGFQRLVRECREVEDNLHVLDRGAVVQGHELHVFVASAGAYPAFHTDLLTHQGRVAEQVSDFDAFHLQCGD